MLPATLNPRRHMKIYLSEETKGQLQPEREFDSATVKVGRDGSDCQIVFDGNLWPMVSRKHAEFRLEGGRSLLVDLKSRFGTFLDGRQLSEPAEIRAGSRVQFGPSGPVLRVVRIAPVQAAAPGPASGRVRANAVSAPENRMAQTSPYQESAFLELATDGAVQRFEIARDIATIGRDIDMDIRIAADDGLVSRRHAVIRRQGNRLELIDQDSFNGTLLNDQQIVAASLLNDGDRIQLGRGGPVLYFRDPKNPAANRNAGVAPNRESVPATIVAPAHMADNAHQRRAQPTPGSQSMDQRIAGTAGQTPVIVHAFEGNAPITIGRAADINVRLDGLQISNYHARVSKSNGAVFIEDTGSTNGVYVNGTRIKSKVKIGSGDTVQIGPFLL